MRLVPFLASPASFSTALLRADLHVQHKIRESLWKDHKVEDELPTATAHEWGKGDQELEEFRKRNPIWAAQVWAIDLPERQADVLEQIGEYRKTFAQFLAVGSKLLNLEGFERYQCISPLVHHYLC